MVNAGVVLAREVIYDRIWGYDFETSSRSLDVYVGYLRAKTEVRGRVAPRAHGARRRLRDPPRVETRGSPMSLRWRLALGLGLITLLVVGFVGVGAYLAVADRLENSVDDSLARRAPAEVTRASTANTARRRPCRQPGDRRPASPPIDEPNENFTRPTHVSARRLRCSRPRRRSLCRPTAPPPSASKAASRYPSTRPTATSPASERRRDAVRLRTVVDRRPALPRDHGGRRRTGRRSRSRAASARSTTCSSRCGAGCSASVRWASAPRWCSAGCWLAAPCARSCGLQGTAEQIAATQDLAVEVPVGGPTRDRQPRPIVHHDGRRPRARRARSSSSS